MGTNDLVGCGDDPFDVGECSVFEMVRIRHRNLCAADSGDRRVEVVESVLGDPGADFGRQTAGPLTFVDDEGTMSLAHRRKNRLVVERTQSAQIEDFGVDALVG